LKACVIASPGVVQRCRLVAAPSDAELVLFSGYYLYAVARLLLKYPFAIIKLINNGYDDAASEIVTKLDMVWSQHPIESKIVDGFKVYLSSEDPWRVSRIIGLEGLYEPEVTALFRRIVKKGMNVVDIGCNVGWFSLWACKLVGSEGKVYAFDTDSDYTCLLAKSKETNHFSNLQIFNMGGEHLKEAVKEPIDVVKVDVDGDEPKIIQSNLELLLQARHIIMEWHKEDWIEKEALASSLIGQFEVFRIVHSPFLIKKTPFRSLWETRNRSIIYLRRV